MMNRVNSLVLCAILIAAVFGAFVLPSTAQQRPVAVGPSQSYQSACVALTAELAIRDKMPLNAAQKQASERRIQYWLKYLEEFKP